MLDPLRQVVEPAVESAATIAAPPASAWGGFAFGRRVYIQAPLAVATHDTVVRVGVVGCKLRKVSAHASIANEAVANRRTSYNAGGPWGLSTNKPECWQSQSDRCQVGTSLLCITSAGRYSAVCYLIFSAGILTFFTITLAVSHLQRQLPPHRKMPCTIAPETTWISFYLCYVSEEQKMPHTVRLEVRVENPSLNGAFYEESQRQPPQHALASRIIC